MTYKSGNPYKHLVFLLLNQVRNQVRNQVKNQAINQEGASLWLTDGFFFFILLKNFYIAEPWNVDLSDVSAPLRDFFSLGNKR